MTLSRQLCLGIVPPAYRTALGVGWLGNIPLSGMGLYKYMVIGSVPRARRNKGARSSSPSSCVVLECGLTGGGS